MLKWTVAEQRLTDWKRDRLSKHNGQHLLCYDWQSVSLVYFLHFLLPSVAPVVFLTEFYVVVPQWRNVKFGLFSGLMFYTSESARILPCDLVRYGHSHYTKRLNYYSHWRQLREYGVHWRLSVCLSDCLHDRNKMAESTVTKLAIMSPGYPFNIRSIGQKSQGHKVQKYISDDRVAGVSLYSIKCPVSTPCPHKKGATKLMAVTSSNLSWFSKFFYHWKEKEISNKTYVLFPTTPQVCCHTTFGNLKVQICCKIAKQI